MTIKTEFRPPVRKIVNDLKRKHKNVKNLSVAHKKISIFLDQWVKDNFKSGGKKVGGWIPLKYRLGGRPLIDTGRMRDSFNPFSSQRNAGIGSQLFYSKFHNEGTDRIPQRRILPKDSEVKTKIRKIYNDHIQRALKR